MKRVSARWLGALLAMTLMLTACGTDKAPKTNSDTTTTTSVTEAVTTTAGESSTTAPTTTTTAESATTTQETATTTTTTTATTATTTTRPTPKKPIRILAVGNSFSVDAMQKHLFHVLTSLGYDDVVLGNLYVGGCSVDMHWERINQQTADYTYYQFNPVDEVWESEFRAPITQAFGSVEWDYITVQQASPDSGRPGTFGNLENLVGWLKQQCPDATILYHMTWAYQKDSNHWAFPAYYGKDQDKMYNDIVATTRDVAAQTDGVQGVIPVGTAIQNLRTSSLGDTLTSDGHHLLDTYGDYTAAVTWGVYIAGVSADKVTYRPDSVIQHFDEIAASVNHALEQPYAVTPCAET